MPVRCLTSHCVHTGLCDTPVSAGRRRRRSAARAVIAGLLALSCGDAIAADHGGSTIEITPSALTMIVGAVEPVTAVVLDAAGTPVGGVDVFWSSEQPQVASVTAEGIVTAVSSGKTQIAASRNGASAVIPVSVSSLPVTLVRIQPASVDVWLGAAVLLIAEPLDAAGSIVSGLPVIWSSANTSIATVNANGMVTGVAPGTVLVTATVAGLTGYAIVTVRRSPIRASH